MILSGTIKDGETVVISGGKQGLTFNGKVAAGGVSALAAAGRLVWRGTGRYSTPPPCVRTGCG